MWQIGKQLKKAAFSCVTLTRLTRISKNCLSCVFLVRVDHMRDSSETFGGQKYRYSHLAHTCRFTSLL